MSKKTSDHFSAMSPRIMDLWEKRANEEVLGALNLESLALRNSLPELLEHIASCLSTTIQRTDSRSLMDRADSLRIGKHHGKDRATSTLCTMEQLISEYHVLRQVIFDVMNKREELTPVEQEIIICAVEQAVNDAASQFSSTTREIQEKVARTLAHDFRNPLAAARMGAERIIRKQNDSEFCARNAASIILRLDRLNGMVEDLLDASLVQAGQPLLLHRGECDIYRIAEAALQAAKEVYGDRFVLKGEPFAIGNWDEHGLHRVIDNLVTNAVKHGDNQANITLTVRQEFETIGFDVHNCGASIPEENWSVLFQQYRQGRPGEQKGYGLGLTVVQGIVQANNGTIRVKSSDDAGTTFSVNLARNSVARPHQTDQS